MRLVRKVDTTVADVYNETGGYAMRMNIFENKARYRNEKEKIDLGMKGDINLTA